MLKSDKQTSAVRSHGVHVAALLGVAVLMVSSTVFSGLLDDGVPGTPPVARADVVAVTAATPDYQLRCWQYGRLIFDERNLDAPPAGMRASIAMSSADGHGTVQVMDVGGTTCLMKPGGTRKEASPIR